MLKQEMLRSILLSLLLFFFISFSKTYPECSFIYYLEIPAITDVRLLSDNTPELQFNGKWSPICGHYFWDNDFGADLFCRKLGFTSGGTVIGRKRGNGKFELSSDAIGIGRCSGSDNDIFKCSAGCNDLGLKSSCYTASRCRSGEESGIRIQCGQGKKTMKYEFLKQIFL